MNCASLSLSSFLLSRKCFLVYVNKDNILGMVEKQNRMSLNPDNFIKVLLLYQFISLNEKQTHIYFKAIILGGYSLNLYPK